MESIGSYRIEGELGRGSMGIVYRGFDAVIGRAVAIKVIRAQPLSTAAEDTALRQRFAREGAAAGKLSHPNIVTIYHVGEHQDFQYMAMELIEGRSLAETLGPDVVLDPQTVLSILAQVADGLDYAHGEGVVHRDIKPGNILLSTKGKVKIADFGIARITAQTLTQTGVALGTPAYMAPEQIQATKVDGKADQFALAVIAFQMLTGRKPFDGDSSHAIMFQIVSGEPPAAHLVNTALRPECTQALHRALAKHPDQRFPSCADFVRSLSDSLVAPDERARRTQTEVAAVTVPPNGVSQRRWVPSRAVSIGAIALVCMGLVAGIAWFRFRAKDPIATQPSVTGSPAAVQDRAIPSGPQAAAATPASPDPEPSSWALVKDTQDPKALEAYLERFPKGIHAADARRLLQAAKAIAYDKALESDWNLIGNTTSSRELEDFLQRYPGENRFAGAAKQRIAELQQEEEKRRQEAERRKASRFGRGVQFLNNEARDIFFDEASARLSPDALDVLRRDSEILKEVLRADPGLTIVIEGHTSFIGGAEKKLALGDRRASAVRNNLLRAGIPEDRLRTISYGKERPVCTENTPECHQRNNRVHLSPGP